MQLSQYITESVYKSLVVFFYYYAFMTFVVLDPIAFGFHPPSDMVMLAHSFLWILGGWFVINGLSFVSMKWNEERESGYMT